MEASLFPRGPVALLAPKFEVGGDVWKLYVRQGLVAKMVPEPFVDNPQIFPLGGKGQFR